MHSVTVSVRPEGIGLGENPPAGVANCLVGEVHDSVYLGETAQHQVRVGETNLKVLDLNPEIVVRDEPDAPHAALVRSRGRRRPDPLRPGESESSCS